MGRKAHIEADRVLDGMIRGPPAEAEANYYRNPEGAGGRRLTQTKRPPRNPGRFSLSLFCGPHTHAKAHNERAGGKVEAE